MIRTRDELLADLVAFGGAWLARTRLGGSAREEFRRAWLEAAALLKVRDAAPPSLTLPLEGGGKGGGDGDAPPLEFAPPDAVAANERVLEPAGAEGRDADAAGRAWWQEWLDK